MTKDQKYKEICNKLGFIPSEYKPEYKGYEDDTWENPFMILSCEEIEFLYYNVYLYPENK